MQEYWEQIENRDRLERGMFLILPLKYERKSGFKDISVIGRQIPFESNDFIEMMQEKCRTDGDFVRRYQLNTELSPIQMNAEIRVDDLQLFVFYNGVAFLSVYLAFQNGAADSVYEFIYPGYLSEPQKVKETQMSFLREIEDKVLRCIKPEMRWFISDKGSQGIILKEAYRMNVAYVPNRFKNTEILKQITYNEHRIIDLARDFEDCSEKDVEYVTGAKDVNSGDYGWGCSVTSQEISFVYAQGDIPLTLRATEDLLLTMLVVHQKYSCLMFNEEINQRHMTGKGKGKFQKSIQELKWEAMEFITYGTLASSQISRWNNVCEIYRLLLEMNGVQETIAEIKDKIGLLNEEQERIDSKRENIIGMIIAVFGLVSIVASVLQIVDYVSTGRPDMLISFILSSAGVLAFGILLFVIFLMKKKHKGDV